MGWHRKEENLPGGRASTSRMQVAAARMEKEKERQFAERNWPDIETWPLEWLARACPQNDDGSWPRGPRPQWLEPWIKKEIRRRFGEELDRAFMAYAPVAIHHLGGLVADEDADPRLRADAAKYILDQAHGKPSQRVEIDAQIEQRATGFLAERVVLDDGQDAHPIIFGEVADLDDTPQGE